MEWESSLEGQGGGGERGGERESITYIVLYSYTVNNRDTNVLADVYILYKYP